MPRFLDYTLPDGRIVTAEYAVYKNWYHGELNVVQVGSCWLRASGEDIKLGDDEREAIESHIILRLHDRDGDFHEC